MLHPPPLGARLPARRPAGAPRGARGAGHGRRRTGGAPDAADQAAGPAGRRRGPGRRAVRERDRAVPHLLAALLLRAQRRGHEVIRLGHGSRPAPRAPSTCRASCAALWDRAAGAAVLPQCCRRSPAQPPSWLPARSPLPVSTSRCGPPALRHAMPAPGDIGSPPQPADTASARRLVSECTGARLRQTSYACQRPGTGRPAHRSASPSGQGPPAPNQARPSARRWNGQVGQGLLTASRLAVLRVLVKGAVPRCCLPTSRRSQEGVSPHLLCSARAPRARVGVMSGSLHLRRRA